MILLVVHSVVCSFTADIHPYISNLVLVKDTVDRFTTFNTRKWNGTTHNIIMYGGPYPNMQTDRHSKWRTDGHKNKPIEYWILSAKRLIYVCYGQYDGPKCKNNTLELEPRLAYWYYFCHWRSCKRMRHEAVSQATNNHIALTETK